MQSLIVILQALLAISIIGLVLLQHGKGADIGATFGSGASNTVFGSAGNTSFLFKITATIAAAFFITSIYLNHQVAQTEQTKQVVPASSAQAVQTAKPSKVPQTFTLQVPAHQPSAAKKHK